LRKRSSEQNGVLKTTSSVTAQVPEGVSTVSILKGGRWWVRPDRASTSQAAAALRSVRLWGSQNRLWCSQGARKRAAPRIGVVRSATA
jgi:hypothetical protein